MLSIRNATASTTFFVASLLIDPSANADDLAVLDRGERVQMLRDYLRPHVHAALDRRTSEYEKLKTLAQITAYQNRLRAAFDKSLGGFPARTPLNTQLVGKLSGDGYHAEKLIYESRPGFYVTAILYLPKSKPPYPGVLLPCGHSDNGKAADAYQRASILLARNGIATLCYDPIGQGERKQILKFSWSRVIDTPVTIDQLENTVHSALTVYDLPDLIDLFGAENVDVTDARDAQGKEIRLESNVN